MKGKTLDLIGRSITDFTKQLAAEPGLGCISAGGWKGSLRTQDKFFA